MTVSAWINSAAFPAECVRAGFDAGTYPELGTGSTGDLVQAKVSRRTSDGASWIVRYTQYRYHDSYRAAQERAKYERLVGFGRGLPRLRRRARSHLRLGPYERDWACALAIGVVNKAWFRVGSERHALSARTYGVTTLRKRHVSVDGDEVTFCFRAKNRRLVRRHLSDAGVAEGIADSLAPKAIPRRRRGTPRARARFPAGCATPLLIPASTSQRINVGNDRSQLARMAKETKATLGTESLEVVADRGYFDSGEILACEESGITVTLPKPMTSAAKAKGRFGK